MMVVKKKKKNKSGNGLFGFDACYVSRVTTTTTVGIEIDRHHSDKPQGIIDQETKWRKDIILLLSALE
jgi:hypothetical protein